MTGLNYTILKLLYNLLCVLEQLSPSEQQPLSGVLKVVAVGKYIDTETKIFHSLIFSTTQLSKLVLDS